MPDCLNPIQLLRKQTCECVCVLLSHVQLFAPPQTVAHQASLSMGFFKQEYWSGLPCPPPEDLPNRGIEPRSPVLWVGSLPSELPGKPLFCVGMTNLLIREKEHLLLLCCWHCSPGTFNCHVSKILVRYFLYYPPIWIICDFLMIT